MTRLLMIVSSARSMRLADGSDHPTGYWAAQVGYTSISHFISEFKRFFGETPGSYLQRLQGVERFNLHASQGTAGRRDL